MISKILFVQVLLIFFLISIVKCSDAKINFEERNHTMRIPLFRQKTPRQQLLQGRKILESYGIELDWLKPHPHKPNRTTDSIDLTRFLDHEFYGKVVIGHPGQTLDVAFDTTWSYSWVLSSKCSSLLTIGCYFHTKYDHGKSSEYKPDGRPFVVPEGKYNLTGFYSYDNFSIAHSNATNQSFVEMTYVPYSFIFNKADGVLGLGPKTSDYTPFFYTMLNQKKIKDPIFSIYLNRDKQSSRGGNILLGYVEPRHIHKNNKHVQDPIVYLSMEDVGYWQFAVDKINVVISKTNKITLCKNGCHATVDTSSNTILGPQEDIDKIHDKINAREIFWGRYSVKCDTINKLPKIDFVLDGKNFTLSGPNYISQLSYDAITVCLSAFAAAGSVAEANTWYLGASFLSEFYSIYDLNQKKIGFVKAA